MTLEQAHQVFEVAARRHAKVGSTNLSPVRILIVDNHIDSADALARLLRRRGHRIEVAYDGTAALDAASAFQPAVVLLEVDLPKMDGCEVAARLRHDSAHRDSLLIALTACDQDQDRKRCEDAGFHHHLVKPMDLEALGYLISNFVEKATLPMANGAERQASSDGSQT